MSGFKWNEQSTIAAMGLAEGQTVQQVAKLSKVDERTIYRWKTDIEFSAEVDRLSLMVGIAGRAERLRIAMRVVRQKTEPEIQTDKDLLDWLKFAQSETDGIKLDLTAISEAAASVAESRPDRATDQAGPKRRKPKLKKAR
jgi:hypothetical protein